MPKPVDPRKQFLLPEGTALADPGLHALVDRVTAEAGKRFQSFYGEIAASSKRAKISREEARRLVGNEPGRVQLLNEALPHLATALAKSGIDPDDWLRLVTEEAGTTLDTLTEVALATVSPNVRAGN